MGSVLERLRHKGKSIPEVVEESQKTIIEAPKEPERPKTILAVLRQLEELMTEKSSTGEIWEGLILLGNDLLKIQHDFLDISKQKVKERGCGWSGRIIISSYLNEQDGLAWSTEEGVEIGDKITIFDRHDEDTSYYSSYVSIKALMSRDEDFLEKVEWDEWVEYKSNGEREKIPLYKAIVSLKNNRIRFAQIERNLEREQAFLYPKLGELMVKHEISLPSKSDGV